MGAPPFNSNALTTLNKRWLAKPLKALIKASLENYCTVSKRKVTPRHVIEVLVNGVRRRALCRTAHVEGLLWAVRAHRMQRMHITCSACTSQVSHAHRM